MQIETFALAYAAFIVVAAVGIVVKQLYFTWEVKQDGDEIEVSRLVGGNYFRYCLNVKTKNQTLYVYDGKSGVTYCADWNGKVQEARVVGMRDVLKREELDEAVPIRGLHPLLWGKIPDAEKKLAGNEMVNPAEEIFDNFFKKITVGYRLREVALDYLEEMREKEKRDG